MHGMYFFCQPTVEYIVAYRASDMHGMYYHIMEYTTTSSSGYMEYYYCVDYNYYLSSTRIPVNSAASMMNVYLCHSR